MRTLPIIPACLLIFSQLLFGCKELLASSVKSEISMEESKIVSLEGKWEIDSLNLSSVSMPSFCYNIKEGTVFEFTEKGTLKVYPKGASEPCDMFSYSVNGDFLQLAKEDMVMLGEYQILEENGLMLKSNTFFRWEKGAVKDSLAQQSLLKEGVTAFLTRI